MHAVFYLQNTIVSTIHDCTVQSTIYSIVPYAVHSLATPFNLQGRTGRRRNSEGQASRTACGAKATCILGTLLAMFVFLAVGLAVGLFVGHSLGKRSSTVPDCPEPVTPPPPSNQSRQYKWGDKVKVGGKDVNAVDWIDDVMQADNIKNYLK